MAAGLVKLQGADGIVQVQKPLHYTQETIKRHDIAEGIHHILPAVYRILRHGRRPTYRCR